MSNDVKQAEGREMKARDWVFAIAFRVAILALIIFLTEASRCR
jgi:hypothetical protein